MSFNTNNTLFTTYCNAQSYDYILEYFLFYSKMTITISKEQQITIIKYYFSDQYSCTTEYNINENFPIVAGIKSVNVSDWELTLDSDIAEKIFNFLVHE